jgi:hypothetical protein
MDVVVVVVVAAVGAAPTSVCRALVYPQCIMSLITFGASCQNYKQHRLAADEVESTFEKKTQLHFIVK